MPIITNNAPAGRSVSLIDPVTLAPKQAFLDPGESVRGVLANPDWPGYRAMQESGEMDFGGALKS